jgi:hypothetical protein
MAKGEVYGSFEYAPKSYTRGSDVGKGQLGLIHLNPALFLQMQLVKSHTHSGVDSLPLTAVATPEMVRGFKTREREERGTATWTGALAAGGGLTLTFGTPFLEMPTVLLTIGDGGAASDLQVTYNNKSLTSVDIYWKDDTLADHTVVSIDYVIKGK